MHEVSFLISVTITLPIELSSNQSITAFTLQDPSCQTSGCPFSEGGTAGECTGQSGVLSAAELNKIIANGATVTHDAEAAAKIVTWGGNQWASFDDADTLKVKIDFANQRCLSG